LFVDDEPQLLDGLKNSLRKQRREWEMVFVTSGEAALAEIDRAKFDVVVSDMRMPAMDGAALLEAVRRKHPSTARLVLSGQADRDSILRAVPVTHVFLSKPCDPQVLRAAIDRVCSLQDLIHDEAMRHMVGEVDMLPTMPGVYWELMLAIARPNASIDDIVAIVERDPALAVRTLHLANSAFFGSPKRTDSIRSAVMYLGVELLRALVLSASIFGVGSGLPEELCRHAIAMARLSNLLVTTDRQRAEQAFTVALLHDVGTLLLWLKDPARAGKIASLAKSSGKSTYLVEREMGGPTHAEIGAYLLGAWGLPIELVQAVAYHHAPSSAPESCQVELLAVIHASEAMVEAAESGCDDPFQGIDMAFTERAGVVASLPSWRAIIDEQLRAPDGVGQR
jgi:HD-like signal output (HDOD) protein